MSEEPAEQRYQKLMAKIWGTQDLEPEDLAPALTACIVNIGGEPFIQHPSSCEKYSEASNAHYNRNLRQWEECREQNRVKKDWTEYFQCSQKSFWPDALLDIKGEAERMEWAQAVRNAWIWSDELWSCSVRWREVFGHSEDIPLMMTEAEQSYLRGLADVFTVYRGCHRDSIEGLSWTTCPAVAEYFAYQIRQISVRQIVSRKARKSDVIAFVDKDEEFEIIVLPETLIRDGT